MKYKNASQWGKDTAAKRYAFGGAPSFGGPIGGNTAQSQRIGPQNSMASQGNMGAAGARDIAFGSPLGAPVSAPVMGSLSGAPQLAGDNPDELGQRQHPAMAAPMQPQFTPQQMARRAARQAERQSMQGSPGPVAAFKRGGTPKKGK